MTAPLPPPGWYPDPGGANTQRYFDGAKWTDQLAPFNPPSGPPPLPPSKWQRKRPGRAKSPWPFVIMAIARPPTAIVTFASCSWPLAPLIAPGPHTLVSDRWVRIVPGLVGQHRGHDSRHRWRNRAERSTALKQLIRWWQRTLKNRFNRRADVEHDSSVTTPSASASFPSWITALAIEAAKTAEMVEKLPAVYYPTTA